MDTKFPFYNQSPSPRWEGVQSSPFALFTKQNIHHNAREGQASNDDLLLAVNRMLDLAPATATPNVAPVIPSLQAGKEAEEIYNRSGARYAKTKEEQIALVRALMQQLQLVP